MGETTYLVVLEDARGREMHLKWEGEPSYERLESFVKEYNKTLDPRGSRHKVTKLLGYKPYPVKAKIIPVQTTKTENPAKDRLAGSVVEWREHLWSS